MSDDLVFSDEQSVADHAKGLTPWQVLVVDDDPAVHEVTKLVMAGFEMDGRALEFSHCYSSAEARELLAKRKDIALILLDVVMETDHAGLALARYIREELRNINVRIVLRTGQPGQAPEEQVIRDYDINDYKEKTDLTRRKLITVFYASLRGYRDLMRIESARQGLRRSIEAIGQIYSAHTLRGFSSAVLEQVNFLLGLNGDGVCASRLSAYTACTDKGVLKVLAATQAYSELLVGEEVSHLPPDVQAALKRALDEKAGHHGPRHYAGYFRTVGGRESVIYMTFVEPISEEAQDLLEIFSSNVAIAYEGLLMHEDTKEAQQSTISVLGGAIERRGNGAPSPHLRRMGDVSALLAAELGVSDQDVELLRVAATLHDIGKTCIPDAILTKGAALTPEEWEIMKSHARKGYELLVDSTSQTHQMGAVIAHEHHEHWDGSGYPLGIKGEQINLYGRIVAVADVLDSLASESAYKAAWPLDDAIVYLQSHSGTRFDPKLVTLILSNRAEIEKIYAH
jgi:response regulator RpfG family c-di-GMP phosphodiesterase